MLQTGANYKDYKDKTMDNNKFWLSLGLGLAGMLFSFTYFLQVRSWISDEKMASMGYCQDTVRGSAYVQWVKCPLPSVVSMSTDKEYDFRFTRHQEPK